MPTKKLIIVVLTLLFFIQTLVAGWLGIKLLKVRKQLELQKEPVKTPAMIRNRI